MKKYSQRFDKRFYALFHAFINAFTIPHKIPKIDRVKIPKSESSRVKAYF